MIVDLPNTTTSQISKTLVKVREEGGAVALGRVLTLIISTAIGDEEEAIEAANDASREHPMRVLVVSTGRDVASVDAARVDAQIRVGGDAGASEVVVVRAYGDAADDTESLIMGLLLPDAPVVAWWPGHAPESVSRSAIGRIAQRRITDAAASPDPLTAVTALAGTYEPGDTDFAWTRLTLWRAQLAAVLEYVERLRPLRLDDVEPLSSPLETANRTAPDVPGPMLTNEQMMAIAPAHAAEPPFIRVPKVVGVGEGA
jgi:glucose-6-phosphate dehydrogenase assembly protein OpcA